MKNKTVKRVTVQEHLANWLKKNIRPGTLLEIAHSPKVFVITEVPPEFTFAYKRVGAKKPRQIKAPRGRTK